MQRQIIPYKTAEAEIDLLSRSGSRLEKILCMDLQTLKAYLHVIHIKIEKNKSRLEKNTNHKSQPWLSKSLELLYELEFELVQQKNYLEEELTHKQFLLLAALSDKIQGPEKKETVDKQALMAARESVTLEVLGSHEALMDQLRNVIHQKEVLEAKLKTDQQMVVKQDRVLHDFSELSKKIDEHTKMILDIKMNLKKLTDAKPEQKSQSGSLKKLFG